jgi:hypothetical protein
MLTAVPWPQLQITVVYVGRPVRRCKNHKQPFLGQLHGILIMQLFSGAMATSWMLG